MNHSLPRWPRLDSEGVLEVSAHDSYSLQVRTLPTIQIKKRRA